MRLLLLVLALLALDPATAQSDPYRPLQTGNTWTFTRTGSASQALGTLRATVMRDTVVTTGVGDRPAAVIECQRVGTDGTPGERGRAAALHAPGGTLRLSGDVGCENLYNGPVPSTEASQVRISNPLDIGGTLYPVASTAGASFPVGPGGSNGFTEYRFDYAAGVGHVRFESRTVSPSGTTSEVWRVTYAVVGGAVYGQPVAGEAEAPAEALGLRVFPSPATTAVTVASDVRASVEVVDALGRRVASGEAAPGRALRLDVSAWPAGVYAVRGAGAQTRLFVVAR